MGLDPPVIAAAIVTIMAGLAASVVLVIKSLSEQHAVVQLVAIVNLLQQVLEEIRKDKL